MIILAFVPKSSTTTILYTLLLFFFSSLCAPTEKLLHKFIVIKECIISNIANKILRYINNFFSSHMYIRVMRHKKKCHYHHSITYLCKPECHIENEPDCCVDLFFHISQYITTRLTRPLHFYSKRIT